jgi:hypothetical protein
MGQELRIEERGYVLLNDVPTLTQRHLWRPRPGNLNLKLCLLVGFCL